MLSDKNQFERVQNWVESFNAPLPLRAVASSPEEPIIAGFLNQHPILQGSNAEALLWIRLGMIDRGHEIVQDASRGTAAYIHGMIHRLEGDYWNANYWFGRCQDSPLMNCVASIQSVHGQSFSPAQFTKSVEKALGRRNASSLTEAAAREIDELSKLALLEWTAVWESLE